MTSTMFYAFLAFVGLPIGILIVGQIVNPGENKQSFGKWLPVVVALAFIVWTQVK